MAPLNPLEELHRQLSALPRLELQKEAPLHALTRFALGGPAALLLRTADEETLFRALQAIRDYRVPLFILGGGTNLVVSDRGFRGAVISWQAEATERQGPERTADAGIPLQRLVEECLEDGLAGLESLAGIPGTLGGAVFGNAGAYGSTIGERVLEVGTMEAGGPGRWSRAECGFAYRHSRFKSRPGCVLTRVRLRLEPASGKEPREQAEKIIRLRREKFPDDMRCAGSIFKNLLAANLTPDTLAAVPPEIIREGKIPAAWFLEKAGARGLGRGALQVAAYHANLVYNRGGGTAADLAALIRHLKQRVRDLFGLELEEEVRYVGDFPAGESSAPTA